MSELSLVHVVRQPAAGANPEGVRPPLLILMHGVGSNERQMAQIAPAFDPRFVVVSVRSPLVLGPNAYGWFHVTFTAKGPVIVPDEAEAGWKLVATFIDEAVKRYGADPARVYVGGFSQGAIMALAALLTAPEKVAGAVAMSGRLLPEALRSAAPRDALRGKHALIVHGESDEKLGVKLARWAREQLEQFPLELTYRELPMGHAITSESLELVTSWLTAAIDEETRSAPNGGPLEEIRPGDVVSIPPGTKHWHGASPRTAMTHLAIQEALDGKAVEWLEHVTDEQYRHGRGR